MTEWGEGRFAEFFAELNGGRSPYAWQQRLVDRIITTGVWPEVIAAPTGSGKSSVVDAHVYALAATADTEVSPPRRLAVVVNRRALVDSHADRAEQIRRALQTATEGVVGEAAERLRSLSGTGEALSVVSLRGGAPTDPRWIDDPRLPSVIAATPDMWGSRLLFRGYGTARYARPRDAGLLAVDAVMVLDEAHLNRQLLQTARDAAERMRPVISVLGGVSALQVVATTATPDVGASAAAIEGVIEPDLTESAVLRAALTTPKAVRLVETTDSAGRGTAAERYADLLADQAVEVAAATDDSTGLPRTVLCVVNTVKVAIELAARLERSAGSPVVECWVGRMRPVDLTAAREKRAGLFTIDGDDSVAYLVATQTVEVGIDLDCAGLVTELAPGSALTQRFGRVNRRGLRPIAPIRVVVPSGPIVADRPPYAAVDLEAARAWLRANDGDVSPWAVGQKPAPAESLRRRVLSSLDIEAVEILAQTASQLVVEPDLDFWLRDDLTAEDDPVGFVLRHPLPDDDATALALLRETAPDAREIFPAAIGTARRSLERIFAADDHSRAFRWRHGELEQVYPDDQPRPGDQFVVDRGHSLTSKGVVVDDPPAVAESLETYWGAEGVRVLVAGDRADPWLTTLAGLSPDEAQEWLNAEQGSPLEQVILPTTSIGRADELPWLVLKPEEQAVLDPERRQEWTPNSETHVWLADHQSAVAVRAARFSQQLRLSGLVGKALYAAGLHHDDGKAERQFQQVLWGSEWTPAKPHLAKSISHNAQQTQRRRGGAGWRHEQLSAVRAFEAYRESPQRDLIVRLVGTSHGRGRPFFPLGATGLLREQQSREIEAIAEDLFATGAGWSEVLSTTEDRYGGPWGVAFLEALLRAADCQVSAEGS